MPVGAPPLEPDYVEPEVISWWQKPLRWLQVKWLQYEIFTAATICDWWEKLCINVIVLLTISLLLRFVIQQGQNLQHLLEHPIGPWIYSNGEL
ncbi:hypothetical protein WJX84_010341 [Apatococcus fuscideae]|uniref:Uncharacterized protein n=1 Tax=Apatococcus fuscideae TaxID=2026836 RepID=A0AAW1S8A2_9CHLO